MNNMKDEKTLWLGRFHDDHMAIMRIIPKFEGILREIEYGEPGQNVIWDLTEFATVIKNVLLPHFHEEDTVIYPKAASVDADGKKFIDGMYEEHDILYAAFDGFLKSIGKAIEAMGHGKDECAGPGAVQPVYTSRKVKLGELPKGAHQSMPAQLLDGNIDRDALLKHGHQIVRLLGKHIEKEETVVADLIKRA